MRTLVLVSALVTLSACGATNPNQKNYERAEANSEYAKTHAAESGGDHAAEGDAAEAHDKKATETKSEGAH